MLVHTTATTNDDRDDAWQASHDQAGVVKGRAKRPPKHAAARWLQFPFPSAAKPWASGCSATNNFRSKSHQPPFSTVLGGGGHFVRRVPCGFFFREWGECGDTVLEKINNMEGSVETVEQQAAAVPTSPGLRVKQPGERGLTRPSGAKLCPRQMCVASRGTCTKKRKKKKKKKKKKKIFSTTHARQH